MKPPADNQNITAYWAFVIGTLLLPLALSDLHFIARILQVFWLYTNLDLILAALMQFQRTPQ